MTISLIIHTENENKLKNLFDLIDYHPNKKDFSINLHAKGYIPWENEELKKRILSFKSYYAFPTQKKKIESVVELISKVKNERIIILDDDCQKIPITSWEVNYNSLYFKKEDLKFLNLDTKYESLRWFIIDLISQKQKQRLDYIDESSDYFRYKRKIESSLFFEKIIYIDGGMGDHIMALPLIEKLSSTVLVSCKYPFVYEHIPIKGFVNWNDDLFGGYKIFVYEFGSRNNSKTIVDAFFDMYDIQRTVSDVLIYKGNREENPDIPNGVKTALICTSAAKINNQDSNKDWRDIRWFKLVHELKKEGYYVIQVGTKKDNQIPNVDFKFLDRPISNLSKLIDDCSLWISVDTFFHHFASAIKPDVGICLTPFYNDHAKHPGVKYIEKDCGKNYSDRKWWLDLQQPERKECMDLIQVDDVMEHIKKKLKILIGTTYFNNQGGSDLYVFELAKELVKLGHSVDVISLHQNDEFTKESNKNGINVLSLERPPCYEYGKELDNSHLIFKKCDVDYDIIHVNQNMISDYICQLYPNIKKVATIHSEIFNPENPFIHESIKKYICVRPSIKEYVLTNFGIKEENTELIFNPIDINKFNKKKNQDKNYILFIGNVNYLREKVVYDLVDRAKNENKELWILGTCDESISKVLLENDNVKHLGYCNNVEEYIRNSSYTSSLYFGRAMLESFICDKNCLSYNVDMYGNILNVEMLNPKDNLEEFYSKNVAKKISDVYYKVLK